MPKDTKTLGNSKARACESLGFVHKKGCARVLTQPLYLCVSIGEDCLNCEEMKFCFQYDIKHNFYNKYLALVFDYMSE